MRLYLKRLVLLLAGGFAMTLLLFNLPSQDDHKFASAARRLSAEQFESKTTADIEKKLAIHLDSNTFPSQVDVGKNSGGLPADLSLTYNHFERSIDKDLVGYLDGKLAVFADKTDVQLRQLECPENVSLVDHFAKQRKKIPRRDSWERWYAQITSCDIYRDEGVIDELRRDLATLPIKSTEIMDSGTQVKLLIVFENGKRAVFKPMRFGRDYETDKNHFYFSEFEKHNAEIATFHLDNVLDYHRAVPTVGRLVDLEKEVKPVADKSLLKTFFWSPAKNLCFVGKCDYFCQTSFAICGSPVIKEGSVQAFLPDEDLVSRKHTRSPYRRTYSKREQRADWQDDMDYCEWKVKKKTHFVGGRRLLDLVDVHILDFLIGNQDRHHLEVFTVFDGILGYPIHLDNGRGFGRPTQDDMDILLPLVQCCVIRPRTLRKLLNFYKGPMSLSETLHNSMSGDVAAPVLAQKHYVALERRLELVLRASRVCLEKAPNASHVIQNTFKNYNRRSAHKRKTKPAAEEEEQKADEDEDEEEEEEDDKKEKA